MNCRASTSCWCETHTGSHKGINTGARIHTCTSSFTSLSVYREVLCFISADLAQFDLLAGCGATVTNHYFLLLKLNFDACNQLGLSVCVTLQMNHSVPRTQLLKITIFTAWEQIKERYRRENSPDMATFDSCFSTVFRVCMCSLMSDVWAAWAPGGNVTGIKKTTVVSPVKMSQGTTC